MKLLLTLVLGLFVVIAAVALSIINRVFSLKPALSPRSPLAQAVFDGDTDRVKTLLSEGVDANSEMNVTYQIAPDGNISATFEVPMVGATQQQVGMSVLACAAMLGSTEILRLLLDKGADVNSKDKYGQTPLILAAWQGDVECVRLLLHKRADLTARDRAGKTALMWAQREGHNAVQDVLKGAGAKE